ncbi:hypothetical protein MVEN_01490000 [Mycena venus]|uniref:ARM repeat-containing protein n=1 Tax=Mycena venus TaxID=2733690 RepID=A0A8H6XSM9_9AGAR|nr:hypothetical protein MVEN_01490000 [Mycena venus]
MPPLTRSQTIQSLQSWWSDSNSVGPTMSIHTAAKPLMRLMYHEQVRRFIKRSRSTPLSRSTMDTYITYLAFKYISPATQALILKELNIRIGSEDEALVVAQSFALQRSLVFALLDSPDARLREYTCEIVRALASSYELSPRPLEAYTEIVSLLSDNNIQSLYSWWSDSNPPGPTMSIHAAAKPLMRLMYHEQVRSFIRRNRGFAISTATMEICFSYLAFKYISPVTKSLILRELDTRLEFDEDARVIYSLVLQRDLVVDLLDSSNARICQYTCNILGGLAISYDSASWGVEVCPRIVSLLSVDDLDVQASALYAVARISNTADGVQAVEAMENLGILTAGILECAYPPIRRHHFEKLVTSRGSGFEDRAFK